VFRDRFDRINPRMIFAGFLATLIVASFFLDEVTDAVEARELRGQNQRFREVIDSERTENKKVQTELLEGQDFLRDQVVGLVEFIKQQGWTLPESLYESQTYRSTDNEDDGDDGDVIVRPNVVIPSPSQSSVANSGDSTDDSGDDPADLPVPGVGEATDTAKRIVEDLPGMVGLE
jgi:type II secretory pathway pseudopilin PulG